ncbi:MAG TPA: SDR family NAD(P)-dependent oxidoreductase [Candidatus Elarobacter sp.]|nr:SDR family NAD(P)-dependent oxidoreductase [Candidatus Elarobacter sp.]
MPKPLDGTVALVTGASSGIGAATALALAERGAKVALAARRRANLEALAKRIEEAGGEALVVETDITVEAQARSAVERTAERFGRLDTLVNNAGLMLLGPISGADLAEWERMLDLNVNGLMYCTHAALPLLRRAAESEPRRVADLVNVSSVAGRFARAGAGVYNATKFAVGAFSEALRQEVTRTFLRVTVIEPGYVETELRSHNRPEIQEQTASALAPNPLQAADVADAIAYVVTRPRHVAINEVLIRPTEQER